MVDRVRVSLALLEEYIKPNFPDMGFFTAQCSVPRMNGVHMAKAIEWQTKAYREIAAAVVTEISDSGVLQEHSSYQIKTLEPPVINLEYVIKAHDLLDNQIGQTPYSAQDGSAPMSLTSTQINTLVSRAFTEMTDRVDQIRRNVELQVSEYMQTGVTTLYDQNGAARYVVDWNIDPELMPVAGVAWGTAGDNPLGDMTALVRSLRRIGQRRVTICVMSGETFEYLQSKPEFTALLDKEHDTRNNLAELQYDETTSGVLQGNIQLDNQRMQLYTVDSNYELVNSTDKIPYVKPNSVTFIVDQSRGVRRDLTFGGTPNFAQFMSGRFSMPQALQTLSGRFTDVGARIDFTSILDIPDYMTFKGHVHARPLAIPVDPKSFATLDTGLTN